jgi:hypothetical protein
LIEAVVWARDRLDTALGEPHGVGTGLRVIDVGGTLHERRANAGSDREAAGTKSRAAGDDC